MGREAINRMLISLPSARAHEARGGAAPSFSRYMIAELSARELQKGRCMACNIKTWLERERRGVD